MCVTVCLMIKRLSSKLCLDIYYTYCKINILNFSKIPISKYLLTLLIIIQIYITLPFAIGIYDPSLNLRSPKTCMKVYTYAFGFVVEKHISRKISYSRINTVVSVVLKYYRP